MSWSNRWVGKPSAVVRAMDAYSASMTDAGNKAEFDSVRESLQALVLANSDDGAVDLDASGHAYTSVSTQFPLPKRVSTCNVSLRKLGTLVE